MWRISLGNPLVSSNIQSSHILFDKNAIIPGLDGYVYHYTNIENEDGNSNLLKKIDIPIKTLIDRSPFTFPNIPNSIFIGDKKSSLYTIDVDKGVIISKYSNGEENLDRTFNRPFQINNLLTVIRIDYTLMCMNEKTGTQNWNTTVSEVIAIHKGEKSDITSMNNEISRIHDSEDEKFLESVLDNMMDNSVENSIVSVHKYNTDDNLPVKIYDPNNKRSDLNLVEYFNQKNKSECLNRENYLLNNNFYQILSDYLKWGKNSYRNNKTPKTIWNYLIFKFWEMYYFDDYFLIYMTIIIILSLVVIILSAKVYKHSQKNFILKSQIRKLSDEKEKTVLTTTVNELCKIKIPDITSNDALDYNLISFNKEFDLKLKEHEANGDNAEMTDIVVFKNQDEFKNKNSLSMCIENINENIYKKGFKTSIDFHKNRLLDLGLQNYQKSEISKGDIRIYQDRDGDFIQEENHTITTKFENNKEVEKKIIQTRKEIDEVIMNMNKDELKSCKNLDLHIDADTDKNEINLSLLVVKNSKEGYRVVIDNCNVNKSKIVNNNQLNALSLSNQQSLTHYNKTKIRKFNYKEYNILNNEKINTTHIDEGRLDKNFEAIEKIGHGGFGCVVKGRHKIDSSYYAIKIIELKVRLSQNLMDHKVLKEVKTMMKLNHKNVVRYTTCWFQLKIDSIKDILDIQMNSDVSNTISHTNRILKKKTTNNKILKEFRSEIENSCVNDLATKCDRRKEIEREKTKSGFNWDESLTLPENDLKADKAFSVSYEKPDVTITDSQDVNEEHELTSNENKKFALDDTYQDDNLEAKYNVYFFMQMEYCDGLSLNLFLEYNKEIGLDRKIIYNFFKQIVNAVNHIHKNNVIHRDLKYFFLIFRPHNIFIFGKDTLKIGDFGLATELNVREKTKGNFHNNGNTHFNNITSESLKFTEGVGTPLYQSPEQLEGQTYNQKVDIYAMGIILYEMCSSFKTLMHRRESLEMLRNNHLINHDIEKKYPLESSLIKWMTHKKHLDRPSTTDIIESKWFKELKHEYEHEKNSYK